MFSIPCDCVGHLGDRHLEGLIFIEGVWKRYFFQPLSLKSIFVASGKSPISRSQPGLKLNVSRADKFSAWKGERAHAVISSEAGMERFFFTVIIADCN